MTRLSAQTLDRLPASISAVSYDRTGAAGVVHLGTGAFHRAHQAVYFDRLMAQGEQGWLIQGASLRSPAVAQQLEPQDGLFVAAVRTGEKEDYHLIGSITGVLVAPDDPAALVAAMAAPSTVLVTLTVTEKGYCLDPATGQLNLSDPGIEADIADIEHPRSAPGFIVAALRARHRAGTAPFTVLSCDNLPDNGARTRAAVIALARAIDGDLADWIEQQAAFPSSMVDRIVPATTPADLDAFEAATGLRDEALVKTEPFMQWVVEDHFCNLRPPLESAGVQMTDDVAGWEKAKLRLLNGAHSAIAYLGGLAGHEFVHQAVAAPGFATLIERLWGEAQSTLPPLSGFDAAAYRQDLAQRFANPALHHRTHQIAMDGSQKLPQRWLNTIAEYREMTGTVPAALALALAGWMRWQEGHDDSGAEFIVDDPLADQTCAALAAAGEGSEERVRALLAMREIFAPEMAQDALLVHEVTGFYEDIRHNSAARAVAAFAQNGSDTEHHGG